MGQLGKSECIKIAKDVERQAERYRRRSLELCVQGDIGGAAKWDGWARQRDREARALREHAAKLEGAAA